MPFPENEQTKQIIIIIAYKHENDGLFQEKQDSFEIVWWKSINKQIN